jgi:hypothetical protein
MGVRVFNMSMSACSRAMMRSTTWSAVVTAGSCGFGAEAPGTSPAGEDTAGDAEGAGSEAGEGAVAGADDTALDTALAACADTSDTL